jgi:glycosyltransferase involved in cell wall biosynthesis
MLSLTSEIQENDYIKHLNKKAYLVSLLNEKCEEFITKDRIKKYGLFSYPIFGTDISKRKQIQSADIIYLHWAIGGFLNLNNIENLAKSGKPLIIFMHDMWSITGGCHHSFGCEKFKLKCYQCHNFPPNRKIDLSTREFKKKLKLYSTYKNLYFVSPSKWLYQLAKQSFLTKEKPVFHIPNVVNTNIFKPINKMEAKKILGLAPNSITIVFGAVSVDNPYKGGHYFQKALNILAQKIKNGNIVILIFGSGFNREIANSIPFPTKFLGRLRDDYSISLIYNAANVFVAPSLADNLPTTVMESLACGTPVVGFDVGGIPEMILHKKNGYVAKYKNQEDLALGIIYCLDSNMPGYLPSDFDTHLIINKHLELFKCVSDNL